MGARCPVLLALSAVIGKRPADVVARTAVVSTYPPTVSAETGQQAAARRPTWRVITDFSGYSYRILRGQQRPVRLRALPTDLKWQHASLAVFLLGSGVDWLVDANWLGDVNAVLFVAFFASTCWSLRRGKRDTVRWTRDWVGAIERRSS